MRNLPLSLGLGLLLTAPAFSQTGPGLPNTGWAEGDLFKVAATFGSGSYGHSFLHNGYIASLRSGNGVQFYDFSNPLSPQLVSSYTGGANGMDLVEPHTYVQTNAWGRSESTQVILMRAPNGLGGRGFVISDWSNIYEPRLLSAYDIPGVPGGYTAGLFWITAQAPIIYAPIGSLGLAIIDARDPASPMVVNQVSKAQLGGFNAVLAFAIGNTLILTNSDGGPGFARLDISDPYNPTLINSIPGSVIPYGAQVNGGKLIVPAVSGPVASSFGGNGSFSMHDIFANGFPTVGTAPLPSRGGSAVVQDQFVHIAASTGYRKLDISDPQNITAAGSTAQPFAGGDWDWVSPVGNFAILGDDQGQATHVVPHDPMPDTTGATVTMVDPPDNATDQRLSSRVGITTSDMIDMSSISTRTFIVRPVGGAAIDGDYTNQLGVINFFPRQLLQANTTYEVVIPAGGMKDWVGNGMSETFVSKFTTGEGTSAGFVNVNVQENRPEEINTPLSFQASAFGPGSSFFFSWDFGDGSPPTPWSTSSRATHTYTKAGHYSVLCTANNGTKTGSDSYVQTVHYPVPVGTADRPTHSSTIALNATSTRTRAFCVNPDNDTVTSIQRVSFLKLAEVAVGDNPRTVAFAPDGTVWVVCQDDATVHVLDAYTNATLKVISLPYASAPYGVAMSPDGEAAYVSLMATGQLAKLNPTTREWVATTNVGPTPRGIAISADSQRIFVTRFVSSGQPRALGEADDQPPRPAGEIYEVSAATFKKVTTHYLRFDPGPDNEAQGRGVPNYLGSPTISPDGRRLWIPSKKDNIARGTYRSGEAINFESTVRTISSQIDLTTNTEQLADRADFNDKDMAVAIIFPFVGDYAFHALQGSNAIEVRDAYNGDVVADISNTGLAPQGIALELGNQANEVDDRLWVHNFMSRTIEVYDVSGVTGSTSFAMPKIRTISTVASEALAPQVLRGKQIFYNAEDPRMSEDGYISCASCHLDGEHDGRVWDFTHRGEGLRNTISLQGRAGMAHGNLHWTANFDEVQDFENDIREAFGGDGFMTNAAFNSGTRSNPLGTPKAGISADLDALAAYVSSLESFGKSPHRTPAGQLSAAGARGKDLFKQLNCAQCHSGPHFTDGKIHDVGTAQPGSGQAIGGPLQGFETPTLRGLWKSAPYLHNGSARGLAQVLTTRNPTGRHGAARSLTERQLRDLVQYLLQIDDLEPAPR